MSKPGNNNAYTRAMDKLAAGETLTSEDARGAFGTVRKQFRDLFEARYGFRPADVEHVINLALQPELALDLEFVGHALLARARDERWTNCCTGSRAAATL